MKDHRTRTYPVVLRRVVCVALALILLAGGASAAAAIEPKKNETPIIFVEGFFSSDTVGTETGEKLFPPTENTIKKAVKDAVTPVLESALRGEFRGLDYPLNQAVLSLFDGIRCDENGVTLDPHTDTAYQRPTPAQIRAKYHPDTGYVATDLINFSYDWRLDLRTLAGQLHDFIEYVLECTGAEKVDLIAYSMGSCVASSYMYTYGGEYVESVILYLGALNGSSTCADPFHNNLGMDSETLMATVNWLLSTDLKEEVYKALIDVLYREGVVDAAVCIAEKVVDRVFERIYEQAMPYVFGRIPGFWALIPEESYDFVRNSFSKGVVTDEFYKKTDYYHTVQLELVPTIEKVKESGTTVSVVSKYGYAQAPIIRSRDNQSDFIVDTKYSSIGAYCAPYDETLPADYVQQRYTGRDHISPDRKIDASTCAFPDSTWFIKNSPHMGTFFYGTDGEKPLLQWILTSEDQPTVWDNELYPQFSVYLIDGSCVPLTTENDWSVYGDCKQSDGPIERIKKIVEDIKRIFELLIEIIRG